MMSLETKPQQNFVRLKSTSIGDVDDVALLALTDTRLFKNIVNSIMQP